MGPQPTTRLQAAVKRANVFSVEGRERERERERERLSEKEMD